MPIEDDLLGRCLNGPAIVGNGGPGPPILHDAHLDRKEDFQGYNQMGLRMFRRVVKSGCRKISQSDGVGESFLKVFRTGPRL